MSQPLPSSVCPKCHAPIPIGAPQGLCPKCLLAAVSLATDDGGASQHRPAPPPLDAVAAAFPQLEILELIGQGGMGVVFKARQKSLGRLVALKLLAPGREQNPAFADRFAREARALAGLSHPNIVTIHDFGFATSPLSSLNPQPSTSPSGFFFLLMEFVDGVNLRQAMRAGRFTPEQALAIVPPVCEALQYAHEHGIVHRDIKPENLLLDKTGRIKIADFGIAKLLEPGRAELPLGQLGEASQQRSPTAQDSLPAGTPQYMAPEQRSTDQRVDSRADIYSLGVVLYELLTGELPADKLQPPSRKVQIDVRLDEIVMRALEQKPELRFATATDFRTQVDAVINDQAPPKSGKTPDRSSPRLLKTGTSTFTTPERLATFTGQFFHYRNNRGQLLLDERRLIFSRDGSSLNIPLASIRNISIGQYPRTMNPVGIDLLSVTYEDDGKATQILLSPMDGFWALPSQWNENVANWFHALRSAIVAATGREPATTSPDQLGIPAGSRAIYFLYCLPVALALFIFFGIVLSRPYTPAMLPVVLIPLIFIVGFFAAIFVVPILLGRHRPATSGKIAPPRPASRSQRFWIATTFFAALLITANFSVPHLSVLGDGSTRTWTLGLTTPWLAEIHQTFPNGSSQHEVRTHFYRFSFLSGFIAVAAWIGLGRILRSINGSAHLRVRTESDSIGHSRILWGNALLAWISAVAISAVGSCFLIALIASFGRGAPPVMPTLMFNVFPATLIVGMALFARQRRPHDSPPQGLHAPFITQTFRRSEISFVRWFALLLGAALFLGGIAFLILLAGKSLTDSPAHLAPPQPIQVTPTIPLLSNDAAALRLEFAQKRLERIKSLAADRTPLFERIDAEADVLMAEAELRGDKLGAARARLNQAEKKLETTRMLHAAGRLTEPDFEQAELAEAIARAEVISLEAQAVANNQSRIQSRITFATRLLENAQRKFDRGQATEEEVDQAKFEYQLAKDALKPKGE